jgi:hypothetical protein
MKTYSKILIAGTLLASMSFGQQGDPFREERFKAKFGRYSQAEEARRHLTSRKAVSEEPCADRECCRHKHAANYQPIPTVQATTTAPKNEVASNETQAFLDAWSRAKFGRVIRRAESPSVEKLAQASRANAEVPVSDVCECPTCCD